MATAFLVALVLSLQPPAAVSYCDVAKPVGTVLEELSRSTGVRLEADPVANREIVLVSVKDMPFKLFLDRLAAVTSCEWERNDGAWVLKPDEAQRNKEAAEEFAARTKIVDKAIKEAIKKGFETIPPGTIDLTNDPSLTITVDGMTVTTNTPSRATDSAVSATEVSQTPMVPWSRALGTILSLIDPAEIAAIDDGERRVWAANSPTAGQGLLPDGSGDAVTTWITENNAAFQRTIDAPFTDSFTQMVKPVTTRPSNALLKISLGDRLFFGGNGFQVALDVYDDEGNEVLRADAQIRCDFGNDVPAPSSSRASTTPKGTPIVYSEESAKLRGFFNSNANLPPDLLAKVRHPEIKDPLAYMETDRILAVARHEGYQLIADLPDESFSFDKGGPDAATTLEQVQESLADGRILSPSLDGDCLLLRPTQPAKERSVRLDRQSLAALIAASVAKGTPSLDDLCEYALFNGRPDLNPIATCYGFGLVPALISPTDYSSSLASDILIGSESADWIMLRFYGSLSPMQKQVIRAGERLPVVELTEGQQNLLAAVLYAQDCLERGNTDLSGYDLIKHTLIGSNVETSGTLDPTELMPNGLPRAGYLVCSSTNEPVILPIGSTDAMDYLAPSDFVTDETAKESPNSDYQDNWPPFGFLGDRTDLAIAFHSGSGASLTRFLFDVSIPADAQKVSLTALPSRLRKLVDRLKLDYLTTKNPPDDLFTMPASDKPPPHR